MHKEDVRAAHAYSRQMSKAEEAALLWDVWHATAQAIRETVSHTGISFRQASVDAGYAGIALNSAIHPSREKRNWGIVENCLAMLTEEAVKQNK